jgi:hypothetical protein
VKLVDASGSETGAGAGLGRVERCERCRGRVLKGCGRSLSSVRLPISKVSRGTGGAGPMPYYRVELIPYRNDKPGGDGITDREERRFANLGEALDRAREMYRWKNAPAKGFRIFNAAGELLHVWMPP